MNVPDISELYEASWREYERRPVYDNPKKNKKASNEKGATTACVSVIDPF